MEKINLFSLIEAVPTKKGINTDASLSLQFVRFKFTLT